MSKSRVTTAGDVNKTWGGRFKAAPAARAAAYSNSQSFDRKLFRHDILASKAHAKMLGRQGVITPAEAREIVTGLEMVLSEIETGQFTWRPEFEDVHMNVEARLTELVGDVGKKLHTGRSRNDQVGLTFRLYVSDVIDVWIADCVALCETLCEIAEKHRAAIMPGFTHMQPAQPVTLAQWALAYAGMFKRDVWRLTDCKKRTRISPLGAAALAGSTYPLDPQSVADELGIEKIYDNSMDAVSDRDFVVETIFAGALIMAHVSRLCEELIIWSNPAFGFARPHDAYSTGSSIMPQKKNPDIAELARGKSGRVYGDLMALLTVIKGLPLAYNSDLQEDKESFFDAEETVSSTLEIVAAMLESMEFFPEAMREACRKGFINATELADYLTAKGAPFRDAHKIAGRAVAEAEKRDSALEELDLATLRSFSELIEPDVYEALEYENCVKKRETPGGAGPMSVARQIADLREWLAEARPTVTEQR